MASSVKRAKRSERARKKCFFEIEDKLQKKEHRPCEKTGCGEREPRCCLQQSDSCCRDGYTSRWYHMSLGEHFCNECFDFFYRQQKEGFSRYDLWFQQWYHSSTVRPSIKRFVADEVMPYWLKCTAPECGKWREVRDSGILGADYMKKFRCSLLYGATQRNPCAVEEEMCVSDVSKPNWLAQLSELPLLKQSVAGPFLKHFCEEGIGLCPIEPSLESEMPKWIVPFSDVLNGESSVWPHPDVIGKDEQICMPLSDLWSPIFLGLRNLIVALWNRSPFEWLTTDKLSAYLICRGLIRICLLLLADKIIEFLMRKGTINYGFVIPPTNTLLPNTKETVIVIGSGIAGLSAAKHLSNLGIETVVLEASGKVGGRAAGNDKTCPMIINGLINNPLTILCHQAKLDLFEVPPNPIFIKDSDGKIISSDVTERMHHQFSGMMDGALEWSREVNTDASWFDTITKHQQDFHQLAAFSEVEDQIFDLMINITNVDYRTNCKQLTLKEFEFPKKLGGDGLVRDFSSLISKLSEGVDIRLNSVVEAVKLSSSEVEVVTNNEHFRASRVIVTVPLPILRSQKIKFHPPLSDKKCEAFHLLGDVVLEHVILQFSKKFWRSTLKEGDLKFGITASKETAFQYFVDISDLAQDKQPTLMTFISDFNQHLLSGMDDNVIIDMCFNTLKSVFKSVPKPVSSFVTHWGQNRFYGASGSFVKVGSSYDLYDIIAEPVDGKIFFAGESTFRKIPNSVTGAFLSGLREAANIINYICPLTSSDFSDVVSSHFEARSNQSLM